MAPRTRDGLLAVGLALGLGLAAAGERAVPALAQEGGASGGERVEPAITPPAAIHGGTCANPTSEPAYALGDLQVRPFLGFGEDLVEAGVVEADVDMLEEIEPDAMVGLLPPGVLAVATEVDAPFEELFGASHVVAVHQSAANYGTLIACGELFGADWEGDDDVVIGLRPLNRSNYYGYAVFERDTDDVPVFGEKATGVTVYLFQGLSTRRMELMATPDPPATPTG